MKTQNLEFYPNEIPEKMNWKDAMEYCKSLGEGWRLPKIEELNEIYNDYNSELRKLTFNYPYHWSSTDNYVAGITNPFFALGKNLNFEGRIREIDKEHRYGVWPVRD